MAADRIYFRLLSNIIQQLKIPSWQDLHMAMSNLPIRTLPARYLEEYSSRKRKGTKRQRTCYRRKTAAYKQTKIYVLARMDMLPMCKKRATFPRIVTAKRIPGATPRLQQARHQALAAKEKRKIKAHNEIA